MHLLNSYEPVDEDAETIILGLLRQKLATIDNPQSRKLLCGSVSTCHEECLELFCAADPDDEPTRRAEDNTVRLTVGVSCAIWRDLRSYRSPFCTNIRVPRSLIRLKT